MNPNSSSKSARSLIKLFLCLLSAGSACFAQSVPDFLAPRGVYPTGSYTFDKLEAINKYNGVLTYTIPITTLPLGRGGLTVPVNLVYSSALADVQYYNQKDSGGITQTYPYFTSGVQGGWSVSGFTYSLYEQAVSPTDCKTSHEGPYRYFIITPDGAHHALKLYGQFDFAGESSYWFDPSTGVNVCTNTILPSPVTYFTSDGTYIRVVINYDAARNASAVIYLPNGTTVSETTNNGNGTQIIQDRNGNKVTVSEDTSNNTTLTDDLGRTISIPATFFQGGAPNAITQTGYGGAPLQWYVGGNNFKSYPGTCITQAKPKGCGYYTGGGITSLTVPGDSITPGTSGAQTYSFTYEPFYGQISTVTLPSGAKTTYTFSGITQYDSSSLLTKVVNYMDPVDGSSHNDPWTYTYKNCTANCANQYTTVTHPDNGVETTYFHGALPSDPIYQLPTKIVEPDGSTTEYLYYQNRPMFSQGSDLANPYVALTVHSVASGGSAVSAAFQANSVDKNGNPMGGSAHDWVAYSSVTHDSKGNLSGSAAGATIRTVANTYTVITPTAGTGSETISDSTSAYWNPAAPTLRGLLARSVTSGAGTGAASEYSYDSASTGNRTQVRAWDSTKAASLPATLTTANSNVTQYGYDAYGNVTSTTDPKGNQTAYTYDSNHLYAIGEKQAANSAYPRTFSYTWDSNLGLVTSKTDVDNSTTSTYSYDPQGRQIQSVLVSGGYQVNTVYDDANLRVITKKDINVAGAGENVSIVNYDPVGRTYLTQVLDGGNYTNTASTNGTKVQTRYLYYKGALYKLVSTAFPETTSSTTPTNCYNRVPCAIGWTVTQYDQNGRAVAVTTYDGNSSGTLPPPWGTLSSSTGTISTSYTGTTTTVTDQAGKTAKIRSTAQADSSPSSKTHPSLTTKLRTPMMLSMT